MSCKTYDPCLNGKLNQIGSYASVARQSAEASQASATQSAASASASAASAASAAESAAEAAASAEIAGIYLGAFAVAPVPPIEEGALYFNTVDNTMYVWDGTSWITATGFNETTPFFSTGGVIPENLQDRFGVLEKPEVIDLNKSPIYRLLSEYLPEQEVTWVFAHTGQSLAEGGVGGDPVSGLTPYPEYVKMLSLGPVGLNTEVLGGSTVTLAEKTRITIASSYMRNVHNTVSGATDNVYFHGQAWGGKSYNDLRKGGSTGVYEKIISQTQSIKNNLPYAIYKGISLIHGEQDGLINNTNYASNLNQWQIDFNTDIKSITGQTQDIPLFLCQVGSSSGYNKIGGITSTDFPSQIEQLKAHETYSNIYLVCPKYQLEYYDHSHITNNAQRLLGEYYSKAFKKFTETGTWSPLRPQAITGLGNTVTIAFDGRVGNLVFDTTNVKPATNNGFQYNDDSGNTITNVQIINNEIVITLSGSIGANAVVGYAYNNGDGGTTNQINGFGARGNLRDSDNSISSFNGDPLYNWCVIFKKQI